MDLCQTMYQNYGLDESMSGKTILKFCELDFFPKTEKICGNLKKIREDYSWRTVYKLKFKWY